MKKRTVQHEQLFIFKTRMIIKPSRTCRLFCSGVNAYNITLPGLKWENFSHLQAAADSSGDIGSLCRLYVTKWPITGTVIASNCHQTSKMAGPANLNSMTRVRASVIWCIKTLIISMLKTCKLELLIPTRRSSPDSSLGLRIFKAVNSGGLKPGPNSRRFIDARNSCEHEVFSLIALANSPLISRWIFMLSFS